MKKIIKLTELELLTIVKKVISESYSKDSDEMKEGEITERCWKGYTQKGMKTMFGKRYPNCVKKESVGETDEAVNRAQQAAIAINMKKKGIKPKNETLYEDEYGSVEETNFVVGDLLTEAEYQGRKVTLNKPFLTPKGPKKRSVYVKNDKGNVVKVNFGDPNMRIKAYSPKHRKSFRARHNCDNPGPKDSAKYWSCRAW
jgi:hypothetical protein